MKKFNCGYFPLIISLILASQLLLFVKDRESYFILSPAILSSLFGLIFSFKYMFIKKFRHVLIVMTVGVAWFLFLSEYILVNKLVFICGSILTLYIVNTWNYSIETVLKVMAFSLTLELICRLINADSEYKNIYSLKDSFWLYPDTNYIGLVAFVLFVCSNKIRSNTQPFFLIATALSFSRMSWILMLLYAMSSSIPVAKKMMNKKHYVSFFIALIALSILFYSNFVDFKIYSNPEEYVDGSLFTKIAIAHTFVHTIFTDPVGLVFGYGDAQSVELVKALTSVDYSGHTVFGIVLQYGFVGLFFFVLFPVFVMSNVFGRSESLIYILVSGLLSFYPVTLFPILYFVCSKAVYAKSSQ